MAMRVMYILVFKQIQKNPPSDAMKMHQDISFADNIRPRSEIWNDNFVKSHIDIRSNLLGPVYAAGAGANE